MPKLEDLLHELAQILETPERTDERTALMETIQSALADELQRNKAEKEFHKRLNEDMLGGLQSIYKEIAQVASGGKASESSTQPKSAEDATAIFHEASRQLEDIMSTTLKAADDIMCGAESIQERQAAVASILERLRANAAADTAVIDELQNALTQNAEDVTSIVIALSFQDLTGQRIKKVVHALGSIHQIVVETYISAGLMMKRSAEEPDKKLDEIVQESKKTAASAVVSGSELKGPSMDASQKDVDDLLAQLGF